MYLPLYIQPIYVALTFTLLPRIEVHVFNLRTAYKLWNILQYKYITRDLLNVICVVANYFRKIGFLQLFNLKWSEHAYSTTETYLPHMNLRFKLDMVTCTDEMHRFSTASLHVHDCTHTPHTNRKEHYISHTPHTIPHTRMQAGTCMHAHTHACTHTHSLTLSLTHTHTL